MTVQSDKGKAAAIAEMRRLIDDLNARIERQAKRVEKIQVSAAPGPRSKGSPAAEMQSVLADMIKTRDGKQAELESLEGAQAGRSA